MNLFHFTSLILHISPILSHNTCPLFFAVLSLSASLVFISTVTSCLHTHKCETACILHSPKKWHVLLRTWIVSTRNHLTHRLDYVLFFLPLSNGRFMDIFTLLLFSRANVTQGDLYSLGSHLCTLFSLSLCVSLSLSLSSCVLVSWPGWEDERFFLLFSPHRWDLKVKAAVCAELNTDRTR